MCVCVCVRASRGAAREGRFAAGRAPGISGQLGAMRVCCPLPLARAVCVCVCVCVCPTTPHLRIAQVADGVCEDD